MSRSRTVRFLLLVGLLALGSLEPGGRLPVPVSHGLGSIVRAEVGRPLSPVSVSGVARRTSRRN
jgi:hypothetical protein